MVKKYKFDAVNVLTATYTRDPPMHSNAHSAPTKAHYLTHTRDPPMRTHTQNTHSCATKARQQSQIHKHALRLCALLTLTSKGTRLNCAFVGHYLCLLCVCSVLRGYWDTLGCAEGVCIVRIVCTPGGRCVQYKFYLLSIIKIKS